MESYAPYFYVEIGGTKLPKGICDHVTSFEYEDDEGKMDMLSLVVEDPDMKLIDDPLLQENKEIRVRWGYIGNMSRTHVCTIKEIDYVFSDNRVPRITLKALDKGHLLTGRAARTCYKNATLAEVAEDIAKKHGLGTALEIPGDYKRERLAQGGKNDMTFLKTLAAEHGCKTRVENNVLYIEPMQYKAPKMKFSYGRGQDGYLLSMSIKSNAEADKGAALGTQVATVDPQTGKPIVETATAKGMDVLVNLMDGQVESETPPSRRDDEIGKIAQTAVGTTTEALQAGKGAVAKAGAQAIKATATMVGIPALKAKDTIIIENIGTKFSGSWRITKIRHSIRSGSGYTCDLDLTKGDVGSGKKGDKTQSDGQGKASLAPGSDGTGASAVEVDLK